MNLSLTRTDYLATGIFGSLKSFDGSLSLVTLEHSFEVPTEDGKESLTFAPKIPIGVYQCVRGDHQLEDPNHPGLLTPPFSTFMITGVEGHPGLLFHPGNFNQESSGCVLVGLDRGSNCILHSRAAFQKFMDSQIGVDSFILTVS